MRAFAGDEALQQLAQILRDCQSESGLVVKDGRRRIRDVCRELPSVHSIEQLAGQIKTKFDHYISEKFGLPAVGVSVGYSFYPYDGTDGQTLISAEDHAMYLRKYGRGDDHS